MQQLRRSVKRIAALTGLIVAIVFCLTVAAPALRADAISKNAISGAGMGQFAAGDTFGGLALTRGTFGLGVLTYADGTAIGDLAVQIYGSTALGVARRIVVTGWITAGTVNADGTATISGTCSLDLGDGTPATLGLPLIANVGPAGIVLTVNGTRLPTLPISDGWVLIQ
jgi:hypothetical protein